MKSQKVKKLRSIFLSVGLINLVLLLMSLYRLHDYGLLYERSNGNDYLFTSYLVDVDGLQNIAYQINAPGNDIFITKNAAMERAKASEALSKYKLLNEKLAYSLEKNKSSFSFAKIQSNLQLANEKVHNVMVYTNSILDEFQNNQLASASSKMALMDQESGSVISLLMETGKELRMMQAALINTQQYKHNNYNQYKVSSAILFIALVFLMMLYLSIVTGFIELSLKSEKTSKELAKAVNDFAIVATTDLQGRITYVNDNFVSVSGYTREELIGNTHRIINSGHHERNFFENLWKTILSGNTWKGELKNKKKDGSYYWVDSMIIPLRNEQNDVSQFMSIRYDITNRKKLEETLVAAKNEAESSTRAKAQFLANISHEIRTPMNGIIGMSNLLMSTIANKEELEQIKIIQNSANSLVDLVNDVLDFSKLEVDKIEIEKNPFNINNAVNEIIQLLNTRASEKGLTISYHNGLNDLSWIIGDATRFRQILMNLVVNAIKFTEYGKISISSSSTQQADQTWRIQISIKDTGVGIPKELSYRLFQPFSQVDASTTRKFGGSGLGLVICKGLCSKMGGDIWFESEVNKGSTFFFDFIAKSVRENQAHIVLDQFGFNSQMAQKFPMNILVAEDNRTNQIVAIGLLSKLGYQVDIANNGVEALEKLKFKKYDLILMDCHMPELDGFQTTEKIIETYGEYDKPRIIAFTASAMKDDVDACYKIGMDGFLGKPITLAQLTSVLESSYVFISNKKAKLKKISKPENNQKAFDEKPFLMNFEGMDDLKTQVINDFLLKLPQMMSAIKAAINAKNNRDLELHAHTLKGAVANFYAKKTTDLAAQLERLGHENHVNSAQEIFDRLAISLNDLERDLKTMLAA